MRTAISTGSVVPTTWRSRRLQYLSAERENVIAAHPAVVEVVVFDIPEPKWREQVAVDRDPAVRGAMRDATRSSDGEAICRALLRSFPQRQAAGQGRVVSRPPAQDTGRQDQAQGAARAVLDRS